MEKLNNWNGWCGDKIVLHNSADYPIILSPNAILGLEKTDSGTDISLVDGIYFSVTEDIEEVLGAIGEALKESEDRKAALAEKQRAQYAEMMQQQKDPTKASEG